MSLIEALSIDLSKLVFNFHGVDKYSKCKSRNTLKRNKSLVKIIELPFYN